MPQISNFSPELKLARSSKKIDRSVAQVFLVTEGLKLEKAARNRVPRSGEDHPVLKGKRGSKLVLHAKDASVIYGLGKAPELTPQEAAEWGENLGNILIAEGFLDVAIHWPISIPHPAIAQNFIKGLGLAGVNFTDLKSAPSSASSEKRTRIQSIQFVCEDEILEEGDLFEVAALIPAIAFARILGELPPAVASPQGIVDLFTESATHHGIEIEVWNEKKIASEKMGLLQAVSQGSAIPPRFLIARTGKKYGESAPTLYLVGKGITFDTGGVNLKTGDWRDLLSMRKDMCGCAAVLGAILAIAESKLPIRVVAVTPMTPNILGSKSVIPGDIVTAYSGKTVEIQNTDAEGRLILADALHYCVKNKADYIIDVATLTGACQIALGSYHSGLFTNQDRFGKLVFRESDFAGEPAWPLPLSRRYGEELKNSLADLTNMGKNRAGGASIGAAFLQNFVAETPWCHLDIAGTHDLGSPASASPIQTAGRMVHTLYRVAKELSVR
ncbi:MAG: hypothetical protein JNL01_05745 [Bdellovibrionales bacterium]|nr:hypothetical protein [Bdellovibrionales bacterium]